MQRHTVEVTFEGEELSRVTDEGGTCTLYRTPEGTYLVYLDARAAGEGAALEFGQYPRGMSERDARLAWPELFEALAGR